MKRFAIAALLTGLAASPAFADSAGPAPKPAARGAAAISGFMAHFPFEGGQAVYEGVCQGCHMPGAVGAVGAGAYPALAKDENLETGAYPVLLILKGQKAMPGFSMQLDDKQIADVVNYVRTHFGNHYSDKVSVDDVKAMR